MSAVREVGLAQEAVAIVTAAVHADCVTSTNLIQESPDVWTLATVLAGVCAASVHMLSECTGLSVEDVLERYGLWAETLREGGL